MQHVVSHDLHLLHLKKQPTGNPGWGDTRQQYLIKKHLNGTRMYPTQYHTTLIFLLLQTILQCTQDFM